MSFNYEQAYQQVRKSLGKHQISFSQAIDSESSVNKRESFYSEVFFASALKKCIDRKGQLIEQTGENHPDVVMKMNGIRFNFEVTLMTQEDERFRYKSINAKEYAVTDNGFAPIFPDTCYHLTHYWLAAVDIPVASDNPVHYADAIRYNARTPLQGSLLPLTRLVWA